MNDNEQRRVLIIEDEPAICAVCERVLTGKGFEVDIVNDGETAEKTVEKQKYDLLLVDIRLPKTSGIDFYMWLQQEYYELSRRVIFMTGSMMGSEVATFVKRSKRPYMFKPFRPAELVDTVEDFFKKSQQ